jgi:hypothetical protein
MAPHPIRDRGCDQGFPLNSLEDEEKLTKREKTPSLTPPKGAGGQAQPPRSLRRASSCASYTSFAEGELRGKQSQNKAI